MSLPRLSVARPVFISSLVLLMLFAGWQSLSSLPVDFFPRTDIPFVTVSTLYPGAGPKEVEASLSKPLEEELATLEGVKRLSTTSQDSLSLVVVEFRLGGSIEGIEQRVRDRVAIAKTKFPREAKEPIVERFNPSNQPVLSLFLESDKLDRVRLTDWASDELKPTLSRVPKVGRVDVVGGLEREIHVVVDPRKTAQYRIPLLSVVDQLKSNGQNVPGGILHAGGEDVSLRALAQFNRLEDVAQKVVFFNNTERPIRVADVGRVIDTHEREKTMAFYDGKAGVVAHVFKQTGANTIAVADAVKAEVERLDAANAKSGGPRVRVVRDGSQVIRDNVDDVWESIAIGILLTIVVVYFFLGSFRSTVITGLAIPNSLLGAFVLMAVAGFSVNILTLLALSLCVGLLVDDAIVVRENIFKQIEAGRTPREAAIEGAEEVAMAVVAVTAAILAMFGPVGFLKGVTGQFFREFGLVVCFAMVVSLFDAMAVAPMLSAYWAGKPGHPGSSRRNPIHFFVRLFHRFQDWLEVLYGRVLRRAVAMPWITVALVVAVSVGVGSTLTRLTSGFLPIDESDEFTVKLVLPAGTGLESTSKAAALVEEKVRAMPFVAHTVLTVGNAQQEVSKADIFVKLKHRDGRGRKRPSELREIVRAAMKGLTGLPADAEVLVLQADVSGGSGRAFSLLVQVNDLAGLEEVARRAFARVKDVPGLRDATLELKPGGLELQIDMNNDRAQRLGVSPGTAGQEIRARNEGLEVGKFRERGREYDIRVTAADPPELWLNRKDEILVPNVNRIPVDLRKAAVFTQTRSPAKIDRFNRSYAARVTADLATDASLADILKRVQGIMAEESRQMPGLKYGLEGDSESFEEMSASMGKALLFGIVLLFLVLASLYESFLVAFLNIVTLPLAVTGAFAALWLTGQGVHLYSVIGVLLLLGVATKNSILLVDTANERLRVLGDGKGRLRDDATVQREIADASVRRLRPILMTSLALVAGTLPIAIGLNEASAQRTGMGIAIVGGAISSTIFTLVFVPCLIVLVERMRRMKSLRPVTVVTAEMRQRA